MEIYDNHKVEVHFWRAGPEAFIEHTEYETNHFLEQYEEGMELGEWQEVADNLYTRIKTEENPEVIKSAQPDW